VSESTHEKAFLCYASEDKEEVRRLYENLVQAGFMLWFDEKDLLPGQVWRIEIQRALRMAGAVIVCLSERSVTKRGFVQREIFESLEISAEMPEGSIFIIPVRLSPCKIPYSLSKWQYVDLYEPAGYYKLLRSLMLSCPGHCTKDLNELETLIKQIRKDIGSDVSSPFVIEQRAQFPISVPHNFGPPKTRDFVGREEALDILHSNLFENEKNITLTSNLMAKVIGMAGVGKTAFADRYARKFASSYTGGVWWINWGPNREKELAELFDKILLSFPESSLPINTEFSPDKKALFAITLLSRHGKSLLIYDNVEDLEELSQWLPAPPCSVIVTTRNSSRHPQFKEVKIDILSIDESVELMKRIVGDEIVSENFAEVQKICHILGNLPLAIELAGYCLLRNKRLTFKKYLHTLVNSPGLGAVSQSLTGAEIPNLERHLRTSLSISYNLVSTSKAATTVLFYATFFYPDAIVEDAVIDCVSKTLAMTDEEAYEGLLRLEDLSLLKRISRNAWRMHRVVRRFLIEVHKNHSEYVANETGFLKWMMAEYERLTMYTFMLGYFRYCYQFSEENKILMSSWIKEYCRLPLSDKNKALIEDLNSIPSKTIIDFAATLDNFAGEVPYFLPIEYIINSFNDYQWQCWLQEAKETTIGMTIREVVSNPESFLWKSQYNQKIGNTNWYRYFLHALDVVDPMRVIKYFIKSAVSPSGGSRDHGLIYNSVDDLNIAIPICIAKVNEARISDFLMQSSENLEGLGRIKALFLMMCTKGNICRDFLHEQLNAYEKTYAANIIENEKENDYVNTVLYVLAKLKSLESVEPIEKFLWSGESKVKSIDCLFSIIYALSEIGGDEAKRIIRTLAEYKKIRKERVFRYADWVFRKKVDAKEPIEPLPSMDLLGTLNELGLAVRSLSFNQKEERTTDKKGSKGKIE